MTRVPDGYANGQGLVAVVFDRSRLFLDAVETILRTRLTIAAKATTTGDAVELIETHGADLLIAGIEAPSDPQEVIGLVREAVARHPDLKVIVLSSSSDARLLADSFDAGVAAFIAHNATPEDIALAIRQTSDPSIHFAPRELPISTPEVHIEADTSLTDREIETLRLVARGLSNGEVAGSLWVTEQTVKFHLSNIFRKLGVSNRTQAARRAQLMNLLEDEEADVHASAMGR